MHQTQWSAERPLPPPVSLTSQSHHEKPPEVTCTSRGTPGCPASTRERPRETFFNTSRGQIPLLPPTTSAASMGAGTLVGGGTPQEAKGAAEGGAIGQPIAEGIGAALPLLAGGLKKVAVSQYQRALSPTTKINKTITQKIAPEMIDRGVHGSLEGIQEQAGTQTASLRPQLDAAFQATPASAT